MSVKAMGRVWDLDLPHNKRLVLLAMADHADHDGRNIYPSTDLIAWKTGYSSRQVQRVIDALTADGLLVEVAPARQQHPTTYDMNFSAGVVKPPFDRPQGRQNVTPQRRQNVTAKQSRGDILTQPGVTFQPSRGDIAMSPKPWNHGDQPPSPTHALSKNGDGDGDDFYRELRRRSVGQAKARQIASMDCDHARILSLIDTRPHASDPNSLGRLIVDILDGVADVPVPRTNGAPLIATRPNLPDTPVSSAEMLRHLKERNATS